jgi:Cu+-exporting ATPase
MSEPRHFQVVHRLSRRVRLSSPLLTKQAERCYLLEILLRKHEAVKDVRIVPEIGSVAIRFDPQRLPDMRLLAVVDAVIGNISAAAVPSSPPPVSASSGEAPVAECNVAVEGMTCASCAALIEMSLSRDPRVANVSVNYASQTATVRGRLAREDLFSLVKRLGYEPRPMDTLAQRRLLIEREGLHLRDAKRRLIQAAWLTVPVMLSGMAMHRSPVLRVLELGLSSAVLFGSGGDIFRKAWALARQREANMDTLIALGAGAAWLYSLPGVASMRHHVYFESAAGIVSFVLGGRYMEERAKGKASDAIRKLVALQPDQAIRVTELGDETIALDEVKPGDILRVRPGDKVPTDGTLIAGGSNVDEALLTGESLPVAKGPGDGVIGGCVNGTGSFTLRVTAVGGDTVLAGIVKLVDHAQGAKLPVQKLADRISARFVPAVGAVAAATLGAWLLAGHPVSRALSHAVAVLLIACPCALGLATPTAIMVGTGQAARRGIYIRNGESLETAAKLTTLVFDKTGTITEGRPVVTDFVATSGMEEARLLALVAGVEACSEHYLARALVAYARAQGVEAAPVEAFQAYPGQGASAETEGLRILVGNSALMASGGIDLAPQKDRAEALAAQGKTPIFAAVDGQCRALFAVADQARNGAREAIALLHRLGLSTVMATGDVAGAAHHVARQVGITEVVAGAKPSDKLELIRKLQEQGHKVGMIGDGINDAPALAAADVGFAIGGGADIAVESADITLVGGDITRVAAGIELSRRTMAVIRQNLFWALGYNVISIPVAAAGRLNPMIASAAMAMSSVSVVGNSLRLQRS